MMNIEHPRALSHDEKKAAEAAYHGKPFHPSWSKSAKTVYDGILKVRGIPADSIVAAELDADSCDPIIVTEELVNKTLNQGLPQTRQTGLHLSDPKTPSHQITSRKEAIEAGLLIDVSLQAREVGLTMAVGITKSLWNRNIADPLTVGTPDGKSRIRDMLLAVRLRLAMLDRSSPWIEVPVLLPSHQENSTATLFPIYALFHKDPVAKECLTLIHPKEFPSIRPSSHTNAEEEPSSSDLV